jgi:cysteine synthase A
MTNNEQNNKYNEISELVGNTEIIELKNLTTSKDAKIYGKLEYRNPGGSVKDRIALSMILDAEKRGIIKKGDTIIEATSGNTGIGLAMIAAAKGYKTIFTMPETVSQERKDLLRAYGAELVLVKPEEGVNMTGAVKRAEQLSKEHGYYYTRQFENPANPLIHEKTTGPEIVRAFPEGLDYFVSGVGTGGTITGAGKILRQAFPNIQIIAVEPDTSAVLSGGLAGPHKILGIGAGFIPPILDTKIYNKIIQVGYEDAKATARLLAKEGILSGISSGAIIYAAKQIAKDNAGKKILAIIPSNGERYLSTPLYKDV